MGAFVKKLDIFIHGVVRNLLNANFSYVYDPRPVICLINLFRINNGGIFKNGLA